MFSSLKIERAKEELEKRGSYTPEGSMLSLMDGDTLSNEQKSWPESEYNKHFDFTTHPYWLLTFEMKIRPAGFYSIEDALDALDFDMT